MKSVAIELTDVVESSDIIFIEFAMYLRSLSTRVLTLFFYFHTNQHTSKNSNTPQRSLNTRFARKNRPESKHLFFHHHVNNLSRRTSVSSESGDRLLQTAWEGTLSKLRFL
jgi:hypothetical protein